GCVHRSRRVSVRVLHPWSDHVGRRMHWRGPRKRPRRDTRMDERESLSLLGLPADRRRRPRGLGGAVVKPFVYTRAASAVEAVTAASRPGVSVLAGATALLSCMRIGFSEPEAVVDIGRLP